MNHIETANLAGVTLADLDWLLRGQASAKVANHLGVSMVDIQDISSSPPKATFVDAMRP
jgi:hypothetical protein